VEIWPFGDQKISCSTGVSPVHWDPDKARSLIYFLAKSVSLIPPMIGKNSAGKKTFFPPAAPSDREKLGQKHLVFLEENGVSIFRAFKNPIKQLE
jgi:hypothetical protein